MSNVVRVEFEEWLKPKQGGDPLDFELSETSMSDGDVYKNDIINGIYCGYLKGRLSMKPVLLDFVRQSISGVVHASTSARIMEKAGRLLNE